MRWGADTRGAWLTAIFSDRSIGATRPAAADLDRGRGSKPAQLHECGQRRSRVGSACSTAPRSRSISRAARPQSFATVWEPTPAVANSKDGAHANSRRACWSSARLARIAIDARGQARRRRRPRRLTGTFQAARALQLLKVVGASVRRTESRGSVDQEYSLLRRFTSLRLRGGFPSNWRADTGR